MPFVEAGEIVAIECDDDANYYVSQGLAEPLSQEEAQPLIDAARDQLAKKRDEMLKVRLENKTAAKPKLQYGPVVPLAPAKPAPAPAPAPAKSGKRAAK
jgi:hypothetical protein